MKKYLGLLKYLKVYKKNIGIYFATIVASIVFSIVSIAMLFPFLEIIFTPPTGAIIKPEFQANSAFVLGYLKYTISQIVVKHSPAYALGAVCIFIVTAILLKNFFLYLSYYVLTPIRNGFSMKMRKDLFAKILSLPIGYFTEQRKGDLMSRLTNDMAELEVAVGCTLEGFIKEPLTIIFYLGVLFFISFKLSLILLILLPVSGFIIGRVSKSLKKHSNTIAQKYSEGLSITEETLSGLRVIKSFTAEKFISTKFFTSNTELFNARNTVNFRKDIASPLSEVLGIITLSVILWFGGSFILENRGLGLNGSAFITYIAIFTQIINPAKSLSSAFYAMQKGTAALHRIEEVLNADNTISENETGIKLQEFQSNIEFKNVSFAYNDVSILKNINLNIAKGKTVALVGSSGAGKSTLADLVPRFHDVSGGELLIDGINIKDYNLESIRRQISIVTQEPILFNDTIANNIKLGVQSATGGEIESASKVANAYNFIAKKEDGFNSNIGDRGTKLSGGERQRLTIARAVLKNSPILILDEATSSLDTESERLVQDAINKMMQNRTTIVIAHRLSTIRHADEIIVLHKGEIAERGNHDTLMKTSGIYKRLVDMQELK
jgi:subfamily B ATP-binding cassette protein MsbA